ncbi:transmembrane protein, putative (macronuclear) [Tetrahymena thermophila SB210]|uniref:Transmembrane protein, putative n=1 Tax=Tetrahymena thermophila (strain SB210) TaxID=312017 RepID=W7XHI3_TETTS|nr:transmembrane protein, putative [Tetrahymena thermophila SB210]EWS76733.1 transmembrane protein, putative [Tetrahymena thermophila SB210]|eukprot:XP_012650726.1 transmembrane protein, putative [Tetrahymena thermophila SB210]
MEMVMDVKAVRLVLFLNKVYLFIIQIMVFIAKQDIPIVDIMLNIIVAQMINQPKRNYNKRQ